MKPNRFTATLAFAATIAASGGAFAANVFSAEYYPFPELASTNGAISATTQETRTDARTMGARGQSISDERSREILMYLKAGG